MKRVWLSMACLMLLSVGSALAQDSSENLRLHLKTGEILEGELKSADEDGVRLDIGDGIELFIRWSYTRGDAHYELRKKQTDFRDIDSVMRLADFCHDFAMDEEQSYVLVAALKLDPTHEEARERLDALPEVKGLEVPGRKDATPEPEAEPEDEPDDQPPPTRGPFKVWIDMQSDDDATLAWLKERLEGEDYRIGTASSHEIRLEIEVELKLIRNPTFMGAELYAVYDGKLSYKAWREGQDRHFTADTIEVKEVRRDNKDEARSSCRTSLLEEAFPSLFNEMEKLR